MASPSEGSSPSEASLPSETDGSLDEINPAIRSRQLLVFDLDGTLIDSLPEIRASVNAVRRERGLPERSAEDIRRGIGGGARVLLERTSADAYGNEAELDRLFDDLMKEYRVQCTAAPTPYPGVVNFLGRADEAGQKLALLTNKPLEITRSTLDALGWTDRFALVRCPENSPARKPAPGGLIDLMATLGARPPSTLMIGDSHNDFDAGRGAGVLTLGFRGGYHTPECRPDLWFDDWTRLDLASASQANQGE